jgi:hypothetical protein
MDVERVVVDPVTQETFGQVVVKMADHVGAVQEYIGHHLPELRGEVRALAEVRGKVFRELGAQVTGQQNILQQVLVEVQAILDLDLEVVDLDLDLEMEDLEMEDLDEEDLDLEEEDLGLQGMDLDLEEADVPANHIERRACDSSEKARLRII